MGKDAFAIIREAMRGKDMVAIGRVVIAKRERIMMLQPWSNGLIGTTLRYASEVRDVETYFADLPNVEIPADMLALAEHIVDSKRADFDPKLVADRYEDALVSMIKSKQAGTPPTSKQPEFHDRKVVDLMAALKASLAATPAPAEKLRSRSRSPAPWTRSGRRASETCCYRSPARMSPRKLRRPQSTPAAKLKSTVRRAG